MALRGDPVIADCMVRRMEGISWRLVKVLVTNELSAIAASMLAGKLSFTATMIYGKVGGGYFQPRCRWERGRRWVQSERLQRGLAWWRRAHWRMAPRQIPVGG